MSNDIIRRHICDMSTGIQDTVISSVKPSKMFLMQVDESTDISGKAQLVAFIRFVSDEKISDQFFMGRHLFTADYTCFRTTFMTKSNAFV